MSKKQSKPGITASAKRRRDAAAAATTVGRVALGLVFIAAGLLKWFDPAGQGNYYGKFARLANPPCEVP